MLRIPRSEALRILYRFTELRKAMDAGDTEGFGTKALQGHKARWRLRIGNYGAVYTVDGGRLRVWVLAVGDRRDVCRGQY